mgnify:CR=1 FL=1
MESGVNRIFAVEYVVRDFINTEINPHTDATSNMGNLAKGSPLIKKINFFLFLT